MQENPNGNPCHDIESTSSNPPPKPDKKKSGQKNLINEGEQGPVDTRRNGDNQKKGKNQSGGNYCSPIPVQQGRGGYNYQSPRPYRGNTPQHYNPSQEY